jgi:glycosyltransferase involved in cell wall biosynthesis
VVLHIITGLGNGGAEAVLFRLTTGDDRNGHQVVSLMDSGVYGDRLVAAGIPVHTLDMPRGRVTIKGVVGLYRLIRQIKPDVVQTWMSHADLVGGVVSRCAGGRVVLWGLRQSNVDPTKTVWTTRLAVKLCAMVSGWLPLRIVCCSDASVRVHSAAGYRSDIMVVIRNGCDSEEFKPDAAARARLRAEWSAGPDDVLFGMVGRWDPQKDHANFVAALGLLKEHPTRPWRCVLVGPGMTEKNANLVALLEAHNVRERVRLVGPRRDIPAVMNALDLHLLSSGYGEGSPNVLCEAMACRTPCITTDVGDAAFIVRETGWVVPPADAGALAAALRSALDETTDAFGWEARKVACRARVVEDFSLRRMIDEYDRVWGEAMTAG